MEIQSSVDERDGSSRAQPARSAVRAVRKQVAPALKRAPNPAGAAAAVNEFLKRVRVDRQEQRAKRLQFAAMLIELIESGGLADDKIFSSLIDAAIEQYGVKQQALADELRTASSNIFRWKEGLSAPPQRSRAYDIWGLHRLIMIQEKEEPHPFPNPPPPLKASAKLRAALREEAYTAEGLVGEPPRRGAKKSAAAAKRTRKMGHKR